MRDSCYQKKHVFRKEQTAIASLTRLPESRLVSGFFPQPELGWSDSAQPTRAKPTRLTENQVSLPRSEAADRDCHNFNTEFTEDGERVDVFDDAEP